jgi:two-component system, cell cycle response regulator DivK
MNTILLVEDDLGNRAVIEDIFQFDNIGAELAVAASGEEALVMAAQIKPILILMDVRLPGMNGLEATISIRLDPSTKDTPIWAITAYALTEDKAKALGAGCDDYITKPFNMSQLARRLREFVADCAKSPPSCPCPGKASSGDWAR